MPKTKKTLSAEEKIIRGLRGFADAMENGENLAKRFTCRKIVLDLEPIAYTSGMVKRVRESLGVSQTLFAKFIGVSLSSVHAWERGDREPSPMACRFMDEIMNDPQAFQKRFIDLATPVGS